MLSQIFGQETLYSGRARVICRVEFVELPLECRIDVRLCSPYARPRLALPLICGAFQDGALVRSPQRLQSRQSLGDQISTSILGNTSVK